METYILVGVLLVAVVAVLFINMKPSQEKGSKEKKDKLKKSKKVRESFNERDSDEYLVETELTRYTEYVMKGSEKTRYTLIGMTILFIIGFIFYHSIIISGIVCLLGILYPKIQKKNIIKKRQDQLLLEFKDALYSIYTSLSAGISPENAIINVVPDMEDLYNGRENFIVEEFSVMKRRIDLNLDIVDVLNDFADRSGLEDVQNFVDVFLTSLSTGKRQGEIIKNAINNIVDKIEIKRDIEVMISEKKYESRIMSIMPIFLILFLSIAAPDYFEPMYTTLIGRTAMTVVGIGLILASMLANKIMRIEV